jgi:PEP-CTERM motif
MLKWILGCLLLCGIASTATYADTIGPNCSTCGGVVYTLTYAPDGSPSNGTQWYDFTLKVDTTGINVSTAQVLTATALGVPAGTTGIKLLSAPTAGGWSLTAGGTNSGGCSGHGGFDCAQATATSLGTGTAFGVPTGANDIYTFVFGFLLPEGTSGPIASDIKAVYDTKSGSFGGLQMSPGGVMASPVPEPGTLGLLASGLFVMGMLLKRR